MKTKTINKVIVRKINDWISSISDQDLAKRLDNNVIVTGGCITSMLLNEDVNDFDIYITNKQLVKDVAQYYCNVFNDNNSSLDRNKIGHKLHAWVLDGGDVHDWKEGKKDLSSFAYDYKDANYEPEMEWDNDNYMPSVSGMLLHTSPNRVKIIVNSDGVVSSDPAFLDEYQHAIEDGDEIPAENISSSEEKQSYTPVFLSDNAITLSDKIQIILRFYGDPKEIHSNYDFVHTTNYWTKKTGVVTNTDALEATLAKELVYRGSKYPITSIIRSRKFIKRGWHINAGQYLKMSFQVSNLDLTNIYVLQDQLVGVDSLYFMMFIEQLKKDIQTNKKEKDCLSDNSYIISVIDKIF
jgi:hypothetical protein